MDNNKKDSNKKISTQFNPDTVTIDILLSGFRKIKNSNVSVFKITEVDITPEDKAKIKEQIDRRNSVNKERGVTAFTKYLREDSHKVDEKGMTAEVMFTKMMNKIYNNKTIPGYEIETPAVAEYVLDKSKQDYVIKNEDDYVTFDVKGQIEKIDPTAKFKPALNINIESLDRMIEQGSEWVIAGIANEQETKMTFFYISVDYFKNESKPVLYSKKPNFTPFRTLELDKIRRASINI